VVLSWVIPRLWLAAGTGDWCPAGTVTMTQQRASCNCRFEMLYRMLRYDCRHAPGEFMKLKFEQIIDADLQTVWAAFDNPHNMARWQQNLASWMHKSGTRDQPGAVAELIYKEGKREVVLIETVTEKRQPDLFAGTYESAYGTTLIVNHFSAIDKETTRWSCWCNFSFRGIMKFLSLFLAGSIRKRTAGDMERFKLLVETDAAGNAT
jgi:hypothetical protein